MKPSFAAVPTATASASAAILIACCCLLGSCDRAARALQAARGGGQETVRPELTLPAGGKVDAAWTSQVDEKPEGVAFRKDLPFPGHVKSRLAEEVTYRDVRLVTKSAVGDLAVRTSGTVETIANFEKEPGRFHLQLEKMQRVEPRPEPTDTKDATAAAAKKQEALAPEVVPLSNLAGHGLSLAHSGGRWKTETGGNGDFQAVVWGRRIERNAEDLMAAVGLTPRPRWFAAGRRWQVGDAVELTGDSLGVLVDGKTTAGKLRLVYEGPEAVAGHPCGRFEVSGSVSVKDLPTAQGLPCDVELSISSGKVWCSLVHPLVLRSELETIQTLTQGEAGGPSSKLQGGMRVVRSLDWKAEE